MWPDYSPIEHVWDLVGRCLDRGLHPVASKDELLLRIQATWNSPPQADIRNLLDSMPRRMHVELKVIYQMVSSKHLLLFLSENNHWQAKVAKNMGEHLGGGQGPLPSPLSSPFTNLGRGLVTRRLFRVPPCHEGTVNLQTSMPSWGFEPPPNGTAISVTNHKTGWDAHMKDNQHAGLYDY
ncbi:transposable element Tcb2 transposase [Trichonephila clavipes]|nr:transposable element Tcb2 transposase [Trichonephila clavipes]